MVVSSKPVVACTLERVDTLIIRNEGVKGFAPNSLKYFMFKFNSVDKAKCKRFADMFLGTRS